MKIHYNQIAKNQNRILEGWHQVLKMLTKLNSKVLCSLQELIRAQMEKSPPLAIRFLSKYHLHLLHSLILLLYIYFF